MAAIIELDHRDPLGQGVFSLADLRGHLAFSGTEEDAGHALRWLGDILNPTGHYAKQPDYGFADLVSLFVVREFLRKGLRPRTIRSAEDYLRRKWSTARPFTSDELKTDGVGIYVDDELVAGDQIESADRHGQQVMREMVKERLSRVGYFDGTAAWWSPVEHVVVDPMVQFGDPVVSGTRVPTASVADMAEWSPVACIAEEMKITEAQVRAALAFESRRRAALAN